MSATPEAARAALRARQGAGARYDAATAPAGDLLVARRATASFARALGDLSDAMLDAPASGATRRARVARAAYHARMLALLVAWVREGRSGPLPRRARVEEAEVASGVTLPTYALRHLARHAAIHLDVEWRDLGDAGWDAAVEDAGGAWTLLRDTPAMRTRMLRATLRDLGAGTGPGQAQGTAPPNA